jgi:hypothetical protein
MSILRKIGRFGMNVLRKVGDVGGTILKGISAVKKVADNTGVTSMVQGALMSNPETAPFGAALAMSNSVLKAGQGVTSAMSKAGG